MAILTVHHWADKEKGLKEMRRVARGQVVLLTFDPSHRGFWLADYITALVALADVQMPRMTDYEKWLGPVEISAIPITHRSEERRVGKECVSTSLSRWTQIREKQTTKIWKSIET